MNYIVSSITDVGISKRNNQDSHIVRVYNTKQGKIAFAVLCDGMGGLSKGELASSTVVHAFCRWADERLPVICDSEILEDTIKFDWLNIVKVCNEKIKLYGQNQGISLGTTLTAILIIGEQYFVINVGDSRTYEISGDVIVLTKDHSLVAHEIELGRLTPEEAEHDSRRNVLLQCIGASRTVAPDFYVGKAKLNSTYMLCSDGFRHEITEDEIFAELNPYLLNDYDIMTSSMLSLVELNKSRCEKDNITVICIRTFWFNIGVEMIGKILIAAFCLIDASLLIALIVALVSKNSKKVNNRNDFSQQINSEFSLEIQMGYMGSSEVIE